jgi:hypothetical protein
MPLFHRSIHKKWIESVGLNKDQMQSWRDNECREVNGLVISLASWDGGARSLILPGNQTCKPRYQIPGYGADDNDQDVISISIKSARTF